MPVRRIKCQRQAVDRGERLALLGVQGRSADSRGVFIKLAHLDIEFAQCGFQPLAIVEHQHLVIANNFNAAAAGGGDGFLVAIDGGNEDVVAGARAGDGFFYKKDAFPVGRLLEAARFHALQVTPALVVVADIVNLPVCPGQGKQRQSRNRQNDRPGKAEHRPHQTGQPGATAEPDHHFAVAVQAGEGGHAGDEQGHGHHVGHKGQHRVTDHHHHVRRVEAAARGQAQGADQGHRHHHGDQHDQARSETSGQLFANGGIE